MINEAAMKYFVNSGKQPRRLVVSPQVNVVLRQSITGDDPAWYERVKDAACLMIGTAVGELSVEEDASLKAHDIYVDS